MDWGDIFTGPDRRVIPLTTGQDKPSGNEDQGWRDEN